MKCVGHVERMVGERQVKIIMNPDMEGRRLVGRPRIRRKDVPQRDLTGSGLSLGKAAAEARDRDSWRTIVREFLSQTHEQIAPQYNKEKQ